MATFGSSPLVATFDITALQNVDNGDMAVQVRKYRKLKGWTIQHLASQAGMSRSYLNEIELGRKLANEYRLRMIAKPLGVHPADLLLEDGEDPDIRQFIRMFLSFDLDRQMRAFQYLRELLDDAQNPDAA